jgi:hypothetical protein
MRYPSDISEEQWALIKEHFDTGNYGKSRKYSQERLELVNNLKVLRKSEIHFIGLSIR